MKLQIVLLIFLVHGGFGSETNKTRPVTNEQNATARSNILILQEIEEPSSQSPESTSRNNVAVASKQNETASSDEDDDGDEESSAGGSEESLYVPTKQVLKNLTEFVFGEGFITDPTRLAKLESNRGESEDEDDDTATVYPSESHGTSPGTKNIRNISYTTANYQGVSGNLNSPRVGNKTVNTLSLNYPSNQNLYTSGTQSAINNPVSWNHTVLQKGSSQSDADQNTKKLKGNSPANTANNYVILTADSKNKTKAILVDSKNDLLRRPKNQQYQVQSQTKKIQPQNTSQPIRTVVSTGKNMTASITSNATKDVKEPLLGLGNGPTYGPWKTIDVSQALLKPVSKNATNLKTQKSSKGLKATVTTQTQSRDSMVNSTTRSKDPSAKTATQSKNPSVKLMTQSTDPSVKSTTQIKDSSLKSITQSKDSSLKSATQSKGPSVKSTTQSTDPSVKSTTQSTDPSVKSTTQSKGPSVKLTTKSKSPSVKTDDQATLMLKLGKKGTEKKKHKNKKGTKESKKGKHKKKAIKKKGKKKNLKNHTKKKSSSKKNNSKKKIKNFNSKDMKKIPENDYKETGAKANKQSKSNENENKNNNNTDAEHSTKNDAKIKLNNKTMENQEADNNTKNKSKEKQTEDDKNTSHDKNPKTGNSNKEEKGNGGKQKGNGDSEQSEKGGKQEKQNGNFTLINKNKNKNSSEENDENAGIVNVKDAGEKEDLKNEKATEMAIKVKPTTKLKSDPSKQQNVKGSDLKEEPKQSQDDRTKELQKTLSQLRFINGASGKVYTGQQFSYISQCGLYTEPQNVSQAQHSWVTKTYSPYFYLYEKPKDYEKCKPSDWMYGKDMRGGVFLNFEVKSLHGNNLTNNAKICEKYCCKEPRCEAWVVRFQDGATNNCPDKSFCCWLKNEVPPIEDYYIESASIAGVVHRKHYRHPPTGMRSAVPLGGLGAGSFEMRADGTFQEWTIENQSPGGSAKLGKSALEKMFLGVRVQHGSDEAKSAILKTRNVHGFENQSVKSLEYSGAHPVSKFGIELSDEFKDKIDLNMYAFSPFHPRDPIESATPAMSFSLEVTNLSPEEDSEVSFMLNIPFGYNEDTVRKGGNYQEAEFSRVVTPSDCQCECAKRADCQSWTTNGPHSCMLKDTIPLHSYDIGIVSGIRADWSVKDGSLNCQRPGFSPQSGDISVYPLQTGSEEMAFLVTDDVQNSWSNFKEFGHVNGNASHTMKINRTGLHGSVSVSTRLKPKETKLLSIIFSWYFPNKDIADERVGNFYTNMFKDSLEVAKHFEDDLLSSATDISKWHASVFTPPTVKSDSGTDDDDEDTLHNNHSSNNCSSKVNGVATLPTCLQDILVNSMSFLRTAMWFENGRWRQWEAFDCANLDPVHIDFHRIIPYMIFYPDLVKQIMFSWADHQMSNLDNGMIQESLSQGCLDETSREGTAGGRQMTDVNVAFITQAYLIYSWTNDTDFLNQIYPYTARAMNWLIHRATKNSGLPHRRPDAYDLFELEKYDHSAYNSIMYLLALRVMQKMARIQDDDKSLHDVEKALDRAEILFDVEMWDEKKGFYHAWFDDEWGSPNWLMTDIFYGQVWSYTLGLGDLVDKEKIRKHLKKEVKRNDSPFGLKVMTKSEEPLEIEDTSIILGDEGTSCKSLENITKTNSIWMSSSADWSTLQLHLGMSPENAMEQAIKSLDNYRSTLRDQWNFHGITSSSHYGLDGLPWATSHYTLHLVLWHLPLALSGQKYYAPEGKISFNPKYSPPYWLPFYTPSCMGNIEAREKEEKDKNIEIEYTMKASSGRCQFEELSISKSKYETPVDLSEGESLTWSTPKLSQADRIKSMLDLLKRH